MVRSRCTHANEQCWTRCQLHGCTSAIACWSQQSENDRERFIRLRTKALLPPWSRDPCRDIGTKKKGNKKIAINALWHLYIITYNVNVILHISLNPIINLHDDYFLFNLINSWNCISSGIFTILPPFSYLNLKKMHISINRLECLLNVECLFIQNLVFCIL